MNMPTFMESERLWFRAPEESDFAFFTQALQDPRVRRNLYFGRYPFNEAAERRWFEQRAGTPPRDNQTDVMMTFGLKGEAAPLGNTGLHGISALHRNAEWGIFIGRPEEWGKGYGREVATAMLRYAFKVLNLHRVYLRVNADNERGIKAYTAAGFQREGVLRQHIFVEGEYLDMVQMGVLRNEWQGG
jgi:RimJ/RimL family protein N-acetyltransferase